MAEQVLASCLFSCISIKGHRKRAIVTILFPSYVYIDEAIEWQKLLFINCAFAITRYIQYLQNLIIHGSTSVSHDMELVIFTVKCNAVRSLGEQVDRRRAKR